MWVRKGIKMVSVQHGGEHERRRRAGTENVPGIVGLGKAVEVRARDMREERRRVTALRDRLWEGIRARVPEARLNGHPTERLPGTANISYRGVESESVVLGLDLKGIGVSAGSACTSGNVEPSYVLVAMGVPLEWAMGAVRHSLGRTTTAEDVDYVVGLKSVRAAHACAQAAGADAGRAPRLTTRRRGSRRTAAVPRSRPPARPASGRDGAGGAAEPEAQEVEDAVDGLPDDRKHAADVVAARCGRPSTRSGGRGGAE